MMYREPDAAADLGEPSRRPPGPRTRVRLHAAGTTRARRRRRRSRSSGSQLGATRFAQLDPEEFFDFQATRPTIRLVEGRTRSVEWPEVEVWAAHAPRAPRDLVLVSGPEPSMRWRTFCDGILELAEALGVQLTVTLGALLADVAHTRPVPLVGLASDAALVERHGLSPTSYEGPTGITGVLYTAFQDAGLPSASLWASVPHYVAAAPNPKASLALVRKLESIVGVSVDASELETGAAEYERRVTQAVSGDDDVRQFVERLEQAADAEAPSPEQQDVPVRRRARARVPAVPLASARRAMTYATSRTRSSTRSATRRSCGSAASARA